VLKCLEYQCVSVRASLAGVVSHPPSTKPRCCRASRFANRITIVAREPLQERVYAIRSPSRPARYNAQWVVGRSAGTCTACKALWFRVRERHCLKQFEYPAMALIGRTDNARRVGVFYSSNGVLDELSFRQYPDRFVNNRTNSIHEAHWSLSRPTFVYGAEVNILCLPQSTWPITPISSQTKDFSPPQHNSLRLFPFGRRLQGAPARDASWSFYSARKAALLADCSQVAIPPRCEKGRV
jgi:hypothetical protein